jgi:hypothetical protein
MSEKSDKYLGMGCAAVVGGIILLVIVVNVLQWYFTNVRFGSAVLGGFLGAAVGAGIAAFVCQFGKGYRAKAKLGPLPWFAYMRQQASLRDEYFEKIPPRRGESPTAGTLKKESSEPVVAAKILPSASPPPAAPPRPRS